MDIPDKQQLCLGFYRVKLDGRQITLPIRSSSLVMWRCAESVLNKAIELAPKDAYCSQPTEQGLRGGGSQEQE